MAEIPERQGIDIVYEQLDMECADLEKRISSIKNIMASYKKVMSNNDSHDNFSLFLSDVDSVNIIKQYQMKWLHNNYLLSMLDINLQKNKNIMSRDGHFRVMYQIMGFSKPSNLALITLENIFEHENITKEEFVVVFLDSFQESMTTHDPYFKERNKHMLDITGNFFEIKANIKNILNNHQLKDNKDRVKILLNAIHHLFTKNVIDKNLSLEEEKVIQELEQLNIFDTRDKFFYYIPLKEMLILYISQLN